jgi:hypothetical protein
MEPNRRNSPQKWRTILVVIILTELKAQIIDISTGKPTKDIFEGDTVKVFHKKEKKQNCAELPKIELNKEEQFIKVYTRTLFELSKSLTGTESQFVNYLIQYIRYNTGILAHENGKHLTRATMSKETGLHKKTIDKLLNGLYAKEVIGRHKTGRSLTFTVNPFIFMRGQKVNQTLVELFSNSKWAKLYEERK